jgi:hypothetical protein
MSFRLALFATFARVTLFDRPFQPSGLADGRRCREKWPGGGWRVPGVRQDVWDNACFAVENPKFCDLKLGKRRINSDKH